MLYLLIEIQAFFPHAAILIVIETRQRHCALLFNSVIANDCFGLCSSILTRNDQKHVLLFLRITITLEYSLSSILKVKNIKTSQTRECIYFCFFRYQNALQ